MGITFHPIRVQNKKFETTDSVSFSFTIPDELIESYKFKAGQFITISVDIDGTSYRRSYSMSSAPTEHSLKITVKRVQNGKVSNYLIDTLNEGDSLNIGTPDGKFYLEAKSNEKRDHYFFAAGSGITPIYSMIKNLLENEAMSSVYLLFGNRTEESIIFYDELKDLAKTYEGQFYISHALSQPPKNKLFSRLRSGNNAWAGKKGRIDANMLEEFLGENLSKSGHNSYYICGPGNMLETLKDALIEKEISKKEIHFESFASDNDPSASKSGKSGKVTVILEGQEIAIDVAKDQTILDALIDLDKDPPHSCTSGACSSCVAKVIEGKVEMDSCFALDDDEVKEGYILTCQAHPASETVKIIYE